MDSPKCPNCIQFPSTLEKGEGRLDQSGEQYLVTTTWECKACGYKVWERAQPGAEIRQNEGIPGVALRKAKS
jgi:C4-type Zn-finger protein